MRRDKTFPARVKTDPPAAEDQADPGDESSSTTADAGTFEALVSVFGNKDSYGEVVMPGAFTRTLDEWESKGDPIPVYWSHRLDDPLMAIGKVLEASETDEGLLVKAQLDLDNPNGAQTYKLMKERLVTQFSFSFGVRDYQKSADGEAIELTDLDLYEVGPTPVGANPDTELIGVKAGRVLSAKNVEIITAAKDAMSAASSALSDLLKANNSSDEGKSSRTANGQDRGTRTGQDQGTAVVSADLMLAQIELASLT
jgi:HK97 family phage prohead protease